MIKKIALTTTLAAALILATCGGNNDVDIRASVAVNDTAMNSANVTVRYTAENVNVVRVGALYGATLGRLNVATIVNNAGREPDADFGFVSAPPSVSGRIDFDLENLGDGTDYFIAPFIQMDKATDDFPHGYFLPAGHATFKTKFAPGYHPPKVSKCEVKGRTFTTAVLEAMVTDTGNPGFTRKGFCYGPAAEPMHDDGSSACVPVFGADPLFSETIAGLSGNTAYNVRAYAANRRHPTQYGQVTGFRTEGGDDLAMTDPRDGKTYRTVETGRFTWMAENLNYKPATGSWCYGDDEANCGRYGRLYTQAAAATACPAGWHLPTRAEWDNLIETAGGAANAGKALKSTAWDGTDNFGWTALPGGYRSSSHVRVFLDIEKTGAWWTAAGPRTMESGRNNVAGEGGGDGNSVRCMKDW